MIGVGLLAGIGFTVSIFVTELAFAGDTQLVDAAKISIFAASALSGGLGFIALRARLRR
jgi:NhaA family Na+:H+ antiporter